MPNPAGQKAEEAARPMLPLSGGGKEGHPAGAAAAGKDEEARRKGRLGLALMAVSAMFYALMGLLVKLLANDKIPTFELVLLRQLVVAIMSGAGMALQGVGAREMWGKPENRRILLWRGFVGFFGVCTYFYSFKDLDIKDAQTLQFTAPVWTAVIAGAFLGEKWTWKEKGATALSLAGVLLIAQPPFLVGGGTGAGASPAGVLAGLSSGALAGVAYTIVRKVGKAGENPSVPVFVFAATSVPLALVFGPLVEPFVAPTATELLEMVLVGNLAWGAQFFLSKSLTLEKAGKATSMTFLKVLLSYVLGAAFLGETVTLPSLAGAVLVVAASYAVVTS